MRVLLDECVHARLAKELKEHDVSTVQSIGWSGIKNGALLARASKSFDAFITSDKNIEYQQHRVRLPLPVITIATKGNMWSDIEPIVPELKVLLSGELTNSFHRVG